MVWRCSLGMSAEIVLPFEALSRMVNSCGMVVYFFKQALPPPVDVTEAHPWVKLKDFAKTPVKHLNVSQ